MVEVGVRLQISPRRRRVAVAVDQRVDVLDPVVCLVERFVVMEHAAAIVAVDQREALAGKEIADVRRPKRGEDDNRVAIGVAWTEVVQVDLVRTLADGHLVLERPLGHPAAVALLEDVHLLHICFGVLLNDDVDGRRERDIAADMIAVRVRVDQARDRFWRQLLDFVENRLAPPWIFRVDDGHAVGVDEHGRVAAPALQYVEVVLDLVDRDDHRSLRRRLRLDRRDAAGGKQQPKHDPSFHEIPPGKKTRCTNQNVPAAITTIDPANASWRPADSLRSRSQASADATTTTTISWPISTPRLNEKSDQPSALAGRSISRRTLAKPNPWMNPNAKAIQARTSRPSRTSRLSAPTYTMLNAMAGSMIRAGGDTRLRAASESVMLCAIVNDVTTAVSCRMVPPSRSSPTRNRRWSGPIRMWWMPAGRNFLMTATAPWRLPAKYSNRSCPASRIACVS